jgi:two-component system, OmpR family, sensor kinase
VSARRWLGPLLAAALGLAGSLGATLFLYQAAARALDRVLDERLRGVGETAALLLSQGPPGAEALRSVLHSLMTANALEGACVLDGELRLVADATGPSGGRADLLRVDPERVRRALAGEASVAAAYSVGEAVVATGYFPLRSAGGTLVLELEAGQAFAGARRGLTSALALGALLSLAGALALGWVASRWIAAERARSEQAERAAQGVLITRMAAMAAHEIRNPLGVIQASVELMQQRSAGALGDRDREALDDVLGEVRRLGRLTEDLLDLSADRPLHTVVFDLAAVLEEAARAAEAAYPEIRLRREFAAGLPLVEGDAGRLRQVFSNLLTNAAQAQPRGEIELHASHGGGALRVRIHDDGPGVSAEIKARLFDPFVTGRASGTGLGLALSRRIVARHRGTLALVEDGRPGATFEVVLPESA